MTLQMACFQTAHPILVYNICDDDQLSVLLTIIDQRHPAQQSCCADPRAIHYRAVIAQDDTVRLHSEMLVLMLTFQSLPGA